MTHPTLCTYFDARYILKGLALHHSLCRYHSEFTLYVLALDAYVENLVRDLPHVVVVPLDEIENHQLLRLKAMRDKTHFIWSLTPFWVLYCLNREENVAYIDADLFAFSPLDDLYAEVAGKAIAITPHRFDEAHRFRETANGKYNVGWVYFERSGAAFECLREWMDMVMCPDSPDDQVCWNELAPKYEAYAIENLGVDAAPWNALQYQYRREGETIYVSNGDREDKLCLYHMHELAHDDAGTITRFTHWQVHPFVKQFIYPPYQIALQEVALWQTLQNSV